MRTLPPPGWADAACSRPRKTESAPRWPLSHLGRFAFGAIYSRRNSDGTPCCVSIADCAGQLPASEGRRSIAFDVVSGLRISTAAAARIRDRSPSTLAGARCGPEIWPRAHEIHRLRCDRRHGLGIGRHTCLRAVRQVRLTVAPHVIEGPAARPKIETC